VRILFHHVLLGEFVSDPDSNWKRFRRMPIKLRET